jgi:hypothetical protein
MRDMCAFWELFHTGSSAASHAWHFVLSRMNMVADGAATLHSSPDLFDTLERAVARVTTQIKWECSPGGGIELFMIVPVVLWMRAHGGEFTADGCGFSWRGVDMVTASRHEWDMWLSMSRSDLMSIPPLRSETQPTFDHGGWETWVERSSSQRIQFGDTDDTELPKDPNAPDNIIKTVLTEGWA